MIWIIQQDVFRNEEILLDAIIKNNDYAYLLYYNPTESNNISKINKMFCDDQIVIFYGSLNLAKHVKHYLKFYPGIYLNSDNYECHNYYGKYGDYLLNNDYVMLGLNDLLRNKDKLFRTSDKIFIRPSNGIKTFPGQLMSKSNFEEEYYKLIKTYHLDNVLVVVSDYKSIEEEWRFVVVDGEVITGALYMDKHNRESLNPYYNIEAKDAGVWDFVQNVSQLYSPDRVFTLDLCKHQKQYKVLEVNSFCCAGLYGIDYHKMVKAVNNLCVKDYNDVYNL